MFKPRTKSGFDRNLSSERQLNKLEREIESKELRNIKRKKNYYYHSAFKSFVEFEWQLYIGGKPFPRKKRMTVNEVAAANRNFEDKFANTIDADGNTKRRLSQWKSVNPKVLWAASKKYINHRLEGIDLMWGDRIEAFEEEFGCKVRGKSSANV